MTPPATGALSLHRREENFFRYWKEAFAGKSMLAFGREKKRYLGLSKEGQRTIAHLCTARTLSYLIEKGGTVPGVVLQQGKRNYAWTIVTNPPPLRFTRALIDVLEGVYDTFSSFFIFNNVRDQGPREIAALETQLHDISAQQGDGPGVFSAADAVVLTFLTEQALSHPLYREEVLENAVGPVCFLTRLCWFQRFHDRTEKAAIRMHLPPDPAHRRVAGDWITTVQSLVQQNSRAFFRDPAGPAVFFALRAFIRDRFVSEFNLLLEEENYERLEAVGAALDGMWATVREGAAAANAPQIYAPFFEALPLLFRDRPHTNVLERVLAVAADGGGRNRDRLIESLRPLYRWAADLLELAGRARRAYPYDNDFEALQVIKHLAGGLDEVAAGNVGQTLAFLENSI